MFADVDSDADFLWFLRDVGESGGVTEQQVFVGSGFVVTGHDFSASEFGMAGEHFTDRDGGDDALADDAFAEEWGSESAADHDVYAVDFHRILLQLRVGVGALLDGPESLFGGAALSDAECGTADLAKVGGGDQGKEVRGQGFEEKASPRPEWGGELELG